jgi:hypothetical protein
MSAKASNKKSPADKGSDSQDLEKKVDDLMSLEDNKVDKADTPAEEQADPPLPHLMGNTPSSAPLLPSDKLPDLDKKPKKDNKVEETQPANAEEEPAEKPVTPEPEDIAPIEEPDEGAEEPAVPEEEPADKAPDLPDTLGLEDVGTAQTVDEIISNESDELLAAHDQATSEKPAEVPVANKSSKPRRNIFSAWWHSKLWRTVTLAVLFVGLAAVAAFPTSRYLALNAFGVRVSASVTVFDNTTGQPLKNAEFVVAGKSAKTDSEGTVKLGDLKLGPSTLTVKKPAFAEVSQPVTLGWGSNPLGEFKLKAVGNQYKFQVVDFLSKKPISKAEISSGEANSRSNEKGEVVLTVPQTDTEKLEVLVSADSYRNEKREIKIDQKDVVTVEMAPSRKHAFISKRSGTFDVYKVDIDGKNEEKILSGTGREQTETMALSQHPSKDLAALVSSRENIRNSDGFLLSSLTIIDLKDNSTNKVAQSERIQLVDWIGNKLIYVKISEGASAASTDRHRLVSYDLESNKETELASTNYFNDVLAANGSIYYSPASYNVNGSVGLFKINAEGNNRKTIYDKEVWNIIRSSYDKLSISMGSEWFDLNLSNDNLDRTGGPPANQKSRLYVPSSDGSRSLWTEERDGKGALLSYDVSTKEDKVLLAEAGLKNPIQWLNSKYITYRVNTPQEIADYVLNTEGGSPLKIRNVTDTAGIDRWYYY